MVNAGIGPFALAVNPVTNKIYVVNQGNGGANPGNITVINGADNSTTMIGVGALPQAIAINPVTNKIYVANAGICCPFSPGGVTVIDGATNTSTIINTGTPSALAVNPITNKIYASNIYASNGSLVTVINGSDNSITAKVSASGPIAVNPVTNRIYAGGVTVIDGATNTTLTLSTPGGGQHLAVNPVANQIYFAGSYGFLTRLTEQQVQPIPLTTTIDPLPGNTFYNPGTATFNFTTSSSYAPTSPPVQNVYFQLDTWQGPWIQATGSAPNFAGTAPPLLPGIHIIYAYAADSQFSDSLESNESFISQNNPIPGAIASYLFVVVPQTTTTTLSLTAGSNPSSFGQALTFTASVTPQFSGSPSGTVQFRDSGSSLGPPVTLNNGTAALTVSTLAVGVHNITAAYSGDSNYAPNTSAAITQLVEVTGGLNSTEIVLNAPLATFFRQSALFSVSVSSSGGTPTGSVVLFDGGVQLGPVLMLDGNGNAGYSTPLRIGTHNVQAIYIGDGSFNTSSSAVQTVNVSPRPKPR
jgi:hypothetical protein